MFELLSDPLMYNAIAAGVIIAATFSLLGIFVVLRQVVFVGIAMARAASAGVAFSFFIAAVNIPIIVSIVALVPPTVARIIWPALFTFLAIFILSFISHNRKSTADAGIGLVFSILWAMAIIFVANSGHGIARVRNLIEGDLLMISSGDLVIVFALSVAVILSILLLFKHHLLISYDSEMALALGYKVKVWTYGFFLMLGIAIVIAIPYGGLLTIFTWMVIPPFAGLFVGRSVNEAAVFSVVTAVLSVFAGLSLSLYWDFPASPLINISCVCIAIFLGSIRMFVSRGINRSINLQLNGVSMDIRILFSIFVLFIFTFMSGCFSDNNALLFHSGVGQRSSLLDIQAVFEKEHPEIAVNFAYKGSGYFIADIERSKKGDIYLPGEEFYMLQALERGHILKYDPKTDVAAYFMVVITTPRGNPAKITGIKDFARKGIRIGLGNPKACAIGIWDEKILKRAGIWKEAQANSVQSAKCIAEKLASVQNRIVDGTLMWAPTAVLALRDLEIIPLAPKYRGFVRLPVAVVKYTKDEKAANKLKSLILSDRGKNIFRSHAYSITPGVLDEQGFCTDGGVGSAEDCKYLVAAAKVVKDESMKVNKDTVGHLAGEVKRQRKTKRPGAF